MTLTKCCYGGWAFYVNTTYWWIEVHPTGYPRGIMGTD